MISLIQAIDFLNIEPRLSTITRARFHELRKLVPRFSEDTIKYIEIKKIKDYI